VLLRRDNLYEASRGTIWSNLGDVRWPEHAIATTATKNGTQEVKNTTCEAKWVRAAESNVKKQWAHQGESPPERRSRRAFTLIPFGHARHSDLPRAIPLTNSLTLRAQQLLQAPHLHLAQVFNQVSGSCTNALLLVRPFLQPCWFAEAHSSVWELRTPLHLAGVLRRRKTRLSIRYRVVGLGEVMLPASWAWARPHYPSSSTQRILLTWFCIFSSGVVPSVGRV